MNLNSPTWISKLEGRDPLLKLSLAAFLVYWICMLPALFGQATAGKAASRALLLPAILLMYWTASINAARLAQALCVLGHLQAPLALRRAMVRNSLALIALVWIILAAGAGMALAMPQSGASALWGIALVSIAAWTGMLRSLSAARLTPALPPQLFGLAPWLAVLALFALDLNATLDSAGQLPALLPAFAALSFPAALSWLHLRWRTTLPRYEWSRPTQTTKLSTAIASHVRRYTALTWHNGEAFEKSSESRSSVRLVPIVMAVPLLLIRPVWVHGEVRLMDAAMLIVASFMVAGTLLVRDLSWRSFLAPGGMRRGQLGTHILNSTLPVQVAGVIVLMVATAVLAYFKAGISSERVSDALLDAAFVLAELPFITALAIVLRAARAWPIFGTFVGVGTMMVAMTYIGSGGPLTKPYAVSAVVCILALLAMTMPLLMLGNRLWTTNKLFAEAGRELRA